MARFNTALMLEEKAIPMPKYWSNIQLEPSPGDVCIASNLLFGFQGAIARLPLGSGGSSR